MKITIEKITLQRQSRALLFSYIFENELNLRSVMTDFPADLVD